MDIFGIIIGLGLFLIYAVLFASTINSLYGGGFVISREWWDDDYRKFRKTTFKSRIKAVFLALLIHGIYFSIMAICAHIKVEGKGNTNGLMILFSIIFLVLCGSEGPNDLN